LQGNFEKALNFIESALEIQEDYFGKNHFEIADTLIYLGMVYEASKNL
jgi:hypothetical protein